MTSEVTLREVQESDLPIFFEQHDPPGSGPAYSTETDEHGFFEFPHTSLGRFKLEITAKGFQSHTADVYMPSDFAGNWAVELKAEAAKRP